MTTTSVPPVATSTGIQLLGRAIANMATMLGEASETLPQHFTCGEADVVATVLALAGHLEEAAAFLDCHAEADDQGDDHNEGFIYNQMYVHQLLNMATVTE